MRLSPHHRVAFVVGLLLTLVTRPATAAGLDWDIDSFDVTIVVGSDGALQVTERIVADFTREPHRGIIREIPFAYRRSGVRFELRIRDLRVTDETGDPHRFVERRSRHQIRLRIGDPNRPRRERVEYRIHYRVERGLLGFETHDELYWNATGTRWPVPIERISCVVKLPASAVATTSRVRAISFLGPSGTSRAGPVADIDPDGSIVFDAPGGTQPWSGLTVVVGWPPGHVAAPSAAVRFGWLLRDNAVLATPLIVFGLLLLAWRFWGRDRGPARSVVVAYDPPESLTPVEVGTIIDESVDHADVTASMIDLAVRGYMTIEADAERRLSLTRTERDASDLKPFEREILSGLFEDGPHVQLDALEGRFYTTQAAVRKHVGEELARAGYFPAAPHRMRRRWILVAVGLTSLTVLVAAILLVLDVFGPLATIGAALLTVPQFIIFAPRMPRRTARGRRALERIKGLEEYITRAKLEDLDQAALRSRFERLLPYAMALNLSTIWARKFENIYDEPPRWFVMGRDGPLTPSFLVANLNRSHQTMTQSLVASPRTISSGSSWSSGGFGGG
ncbi:MAG: DUF2207 domain-containing protein, partial [Phycisphaerae bacterium]|nr:DUF2207 domain-containing protein [Phycisphaerae bacterium]